MKKLLALVLALVMTLGLATVSSSAAYSDANDIEYTEAADVMTAVGVFQGKGDAFAPKDNLNRAEAAKLVAYLMLGNKTAEAMKGSGAKFADVPASHWASGYIEYLATAGVVSGVGGGNFDPNGQVTAVQFAKMLLVALGYDAEIEGFTGNSSWAINIQKLANDNDLYDNLDLSSTAALNREQAAQMCLNDLKADMVEYESKGTTVSVGDAKVTTDAKKATEKASKNNERYDGKYDSVKQLCEDLYGNDLKFTGTTDDLGRPANKWEYKSKDVGTYASSSDLLYSTTKKVSVKALYDVIGKDAYDNLVDGTDVLQVYTNGTKATIAKGAAAIRVYFYKDSTADATGCGNGTKYELYQEEDYDGNNHDRYTIVIANTYLVQATADYSSSSDSVKVSFVTDNGATKPNKFPSLEIDNDDFPVADVKKDDYLLVTYSTQENGKFQTVAKATELEGEVTSYVAADSVTVDGTKYNYSATIGTNTTHGKSVDFEIGSNVKLILDGNGTVIFVDEADTSSSYVYIKAAGANSLKSKMEAEAYFTDGTTKTITVKKATYYNGSSNGTNRTTIQGNGITSAATMDNGANSYLVGQWYTYSVDADGQYTLKTVGTGSSYKNTDNKQYIVKYTENGASAATDMSMTAKETVKFLYDNNNVQNNTYKANSETILIVLNDGDVTVYTGVDKLPGLEIAYNTTKAGVTANAACTSVVYDENNYAKYVFVDADDVTLKTDDSTESKDYMFVLDAGDKKNYVTSSDYYYEYDLYRDGAKTEDVKVDEDATTGTNALATGSLYHKVKTSSKGYITGATKITNGGDYVVGNGTSNIDYNNGTLSIGGSNYVLATDGVVLVYGMKTDGTGAKSNTAAIKDNANASYEVNVVNGSTLESNLDGYNYTYDFTAVLDENNNQKIEQLYVYVKTASAITSGGVALSSGDEPEADVTGSVITLNAIAKTGTSPAAYTINGNTLTNASLKTAVTALLTSKGYTDVTYDSHFAVKTAGTITAGKDVVQNDGTASYVTAKNSNGTTEYFTVELDFYYTVTIDNDVKEYVLYGTDSKAKANDIGTGSGTGFIYEVSGSATVTYAAYTDEGEKFIIDKDGGTDGLVGIDTQNKSVKITTGYVDVGGDKGTTYAEVGSNYVVAKTTGTHWLVTLADGTLGGTFTAASSKLTIPAAIFGEKDFSLTQVWAVTVDGIKYYVENGQKIGDAAVLVSAHKVLDATGAAWSGLTAFDGKHFTTNAGASFTPNGTGLTVNADATVASGFYAVSFGTTTGSKINNLDPSIAFSDGSTTTVYKKAAESVVVKVTLSGTTNTTTAGTDDINITNTGTAVKGTDVTASTSPAPVGFDATTALDVSANNTVTVKSTDANSTTAAGYYTFKLTVVDDDLAIGF